MSDLASNDGPFEGAHRRWKRSSTVAALLALSLVAVSGTLHAAGSSGNSDTKNDMAAPGQPASPQKKEAQALFSQGLKLAEAGDLKGALASFRSAYEKFSSFRVLYNIGQLCSRMGDAACAVRAYEQYLRDGGADVPAKRRAEVETEVQTLSRTIATISITVNVSGAEIVIDGAPAGRSGAAGERGAPIPVNAGPHKIGVTHDGKTVERGVKVAAGDAINVDLEVPKDPPPAPVIVRVPVSSETPPPPPEHRRVPIVPWAVAGGFAVATAVTGVLAATSYSAYKDKQNEFPVTRQALDAAQGSARTLFLLTGLFGTLTIVSAGFAGYFTFLAPVGTAPPSTSVGLAAGPRGVVLQGALP